MIERCYSLSKAAEVIGVDRYTLKCWLLEIGLVLPEVRRGSHQMIRESDLERVIAKRAPRTNLALLSTPSKRIHVA